MIKEKTFFVIKDLNMVAKMEEYQSYLFKDGKWIVDEEHIVNDRFIGYEPNEGIGNTSMLEKIEEITEKEAMKLISEMK